MTTNRWTVAALSLCTSLALPSLSYARSQPASLGRAVNAAEIPCFELQSSAVKHVGCPGDPSPSPQRLFELPLVIEDAGRHWVKVSQKTPLMGATKMWCHAFGMRKDGSMYSDSGWQTNSMFDVQEDIVLRNVVVPAEGYAYAACLAPANATIYNTVFSRE